MFIIICAIMRCFREGLILFIVAFIGVAALLRSASGQANCTGSQMFTAKDCAGDANSPEEKILFELVNKYRAANERPELRLSAFLSIVANRRMLDLRQNLKKLTHSWSNCAFELKNEKTWPCLLDAPQRLNSGYSGKGYETLYRKSAGNATSALALEA